MTRTLCVLFALLAAIPALTLAFAPAPLPKRSTVNRTEVGKNIVLEVDAKARKRRVILTAAVCLREGQLEHLLTRKSRKEHEAILAADIDARHLHAALLLAEASPGAVVDRDPPTGHGIRITLEWEDKTGFHRVDAREWVRDIKSKKALAHDWVFAGSGLERNPTTGQLDYLANNGDVICVANFASALLDLPVQSSASNTELSYEANTSAIPAIGTKVNVILEPVPNARR